MLTIYGRLFLVFAIMFAIIGFSLANVGKTPNFYLNGVKTMCTGDICK